MTAAEFKAAFPEFKDVDSGVIDRHIALATPYHDPVRWEDHLDEGIGLRTAWSIANERRRQATGISARAGDLTSKSAQNANGQAVSVSRSAGAVDLQFKRPIMSNEYGRQWHYLLRSVGKGAQSL